MPPALKPSRGEALLLAALALWSLLPLAVLLPHASGTGAFTGSGGIQISDQLQYMSWIRDAGQHLLFSNRFDTLDDPHLFLHPMWALSGLLWKAGVSLQLSFLLWKPVGLAALFGGFALYARRMLSGWDRGLALGLALFLVPPVAWVAGWADLGSPDLRFGSLSMAIEVFPASLLWEVIPTAISLGMMPLFLLGAERIVEPERRAPGRSLAWYAAWTSAAGALASWLHPWQGITLLAIVAAVFAASRLPRSHLRLALPVAATALPLAYYWLLSHTDSAWHTVSRPNELPHWGAWFFACIVPFFLLALPGARLRLDGFGERALLAWPVAAIAVYAALQSSFFYHALAGLSLPLAVLMVRGARRLALPRAAVAGAAVVLTLPGMAFVLDRFAQSAEDHFLSRPESAAFDYLESEPRPGGVLAAPRLGRAVPAFTDRNTWAGHSTWTPDFPGRKARVEALLSGAMPGPEARRLVREANVAFILAGCEHPRGLEPALGPLVASVRRFDCVTLYELRKAG